MARYDARVIDKMADTLYSQARSLELLYALSGGLLGCAGGCGLMALTDVREATMPAIALGVVGAALGWAVARPKAFLLRLHAQTALCQVQIEANTRRDG